MNDTAYRLQSPRSLPGRILGFILSAALLVLAAMFSLVALAVVAIGGVIFAAWFWWKTRALRRQMRTMAEAAQAPRPQPASGEAVIEGECVREDAAGTGRLLR